MKVSPLLYVLAPLFVGACASIAVNTDFDPATDFGAYHTYRWVPEPQRATGDVRIDRNPLLDRRVRAAVERHLTAKGFEKRESGEVDFLVAYHASLEGKMDVTTMDRYYGYRRRGVLVQETMVREYDQGTLVLDIVDARTNELTWRGTAQAEVTGADTPEERTAKIDKAVEKTLAAFPPRR